MLTSHAEAEATAPVALEAAAPGDETVPTVAEPSPDPSRIADGTWVCSGIDDDRLLVLELPGGGVERLSVEELAERLGGPSRAHSAELDHTDAPLPSGWVGRVVDGCIEIEGTDGTTRRLGAAALRDLLQRFSATPVVWAAPRSPRNPLRDRRAGEHLLEKGWYRLPLLDAETVELLRHGYGEVHGWERAPSALGEGARFEPDAGNPDFEYRARAAEVLSGALEPLMRPLFDEFEPFIWGYYCKWPDGEATALHWDWSCVDQQAGHRSYQVWIALEDIREDNGQLAVLSGSHNVLGSPRGSGLSMPASPTFLSRNDEAVAKCETFVMQAGDAIIFDQGLLHISFPNLTDRPRLACAGAWRPAEADLIHVQRVSDDVAIRYRVNDWWFRNMHPGDLGSVGPALRVSDAIYLRGDLEGPSDVGAFLDRVG